jgi:CRP-like cAMP-binding protein
MERNMDIAIDYTDALSKCMLFKNMSAEEISILLDCLMPKVHNLDKNEIVCLAGEPFEGIGIILTGQAAVVKESAAGNRMILALLKSGDLFGEMAAFSGNGKWPATVIAQAVSFFRNR